MGHDKKYKHEFHFTELTKNKLNSYKEFFIEALGFSDFIAFKGVVVNQRGIKNRTIDEIVAELHYQLIHKSMELVELPNKGGLIISCFLIYYF